MSASPPPTPDSPSPPAAPSQSAAALPAPLAWLLYTNVFIASGAWLLTASTYPRLGAQASFGVGAWVVGLCTLVVYNLDRVLARPFEDKAADSPRLAWYASHQPVLRVLTIVAAVAAAVLGWRLPWPTLGALALLGVVSIGYCLPLNFTRSAGGGRRLRLKDVVGAKLFLIAMVWTAATIAVPATLIRHAGGVLNGSVVAWTAIGRFLFFLAICLPFDVRDMERDRRSGIVTLPHALGMRGTRWMIRGCLAGVVVCAVLSKAQWPAVVLSAVYVAVLTELMHPRRPDVYYSLWIDGAIQVQAVAVLVFCYANTF